MRIASFRKFGNGGKMITDPTSGGAEHGDSDTNETGGEPSEGDSKSGDSGESGGAS